MTASTTSIQEILFYLADELDEIRDARVTSPVVGAALVTDLTDGTESVYVGGLAKIEGKGVRAVSAYAGSTKTLTLASAFSPVAVQGDYVQLAWWKSRKRGRAFRAVQDLIRFSYPAWYRDVQEESEITIQSGTYAYTLPAACLELFAVGIADSAGRVRWTAPRNIWRVRGEPGALELDFRTSRRGTAFPDLHAGEKLWLHYGTAEPVPSSETDTTEIPLIYFRAAPALYDRRLLRTGTDSDLRRANVALPQAQALAQETFAAMKLYKERPSREQWD